MSRIFLAHSSKDNRFVRRLAADLAFSGVYVWLDEAEIKVGDSLIEKISNAIAEVEYLGIILSPNSVRSKWVKRELQIALTDEIKANKVKVLPILYRDCQIPSFIRPKCWADFRDSRKYNKSLEGLLARILPKKTEIISAFKEWSPKGVRLGLLSGLVKTSSGKLLLSNKFLLKIQKMSHLVVKGAKEYTSLGELICEAAIATIADPSGRPKFIPLSEEELTYLCNELSRQVGAIYLDIALQCKITATHNNTMGLRLDFWNEMLEVLSQNLPSSVENTQELKHYIIKQFSELVKARLLINAPDKLDYCDHLSLTVFSFFDKTDAYTEYENIVFDIE